VPTLHTYDYAVIRVVPRVEREEFINVGVIVSCPGAKHLEAAIGRGDANAGPIAQLPARARFHFLTARRSSVVQMSSTHVGRTADPSGVVEHLMRKMVRVPA